MLAIDALDVTIPPAGIRGAGYQGVFHYLRNLTSARVAELHAAGLGVATIFEYAANESLSGATAGLRDGQQAAAMMRGIGQPENTLHIVNLADFAPSLSQLPVIRSYWQAYYSETHLWQTLPYGTGWVLAQLGVVGWQNAMDDNGTPGSIVVPNAAIYQRVTPTLSIPGMSYDEDVVIRPVNWWTDTPAPPPPLPPTPGGNVSHSNSLPVGVKVVAVSATGDQTGRLDVVMVGSDGNVYHKWYTSAGWNGPDVLNGIV